MPTNPQPDYDYSNKPDKPAPMPDEKTCQCQYCKFSMTSADDWPCKECKYCEGAGMQDHFSGHSLDVPQPEEIVYKPNSPHEWERGPQHVEPTSKIDDYLGTAIDRVQVDNLEAIAWALIAIAEELGGRK